jgi:hypothetical protein
MGAYGGEITREMALATYRAEGRERDAAHDQPAREHKKLTSEAAMPQLPDPSLAWDDLLVEEIVIKRLRGRSAPGAQRRWPRPAPRPARSARC